jgi:hypothetical protein
LLVATTQFTGHEGPARLFAQCNSNNARWNARDDGGDQLIK